MDPNKSKSKWTKTWAYQRASKAVASIVGSPKHLMRLVERVVQKSESRSKGPIGKTLDSVKVMVRLLIAYARGDYREVAKENLALIVAALVYFVMPLDALPDFIGFLGLTDDAALLAWTWNVVKDEAERFLLWEIEQQKQLDDAEPKPDETAS